MMPVGVARAEHDRLDEALTRLRVAAIGALARRLDLRLRPEAIAGLEVRYGLARTAELVQQLARRPRPVRPLILRWLLRGSAR